MPLVPGGFVGVDVFFVISGYLIAGIIREELEAGRLSLAGFYERRARRILPALVAMIAVALVAGWLILLPSAFKSFAPSAIAALFSVSNVWFWRDANNYFAGRNDEVPLLHTWSLGVEEQFYLIAPLLLLAVFRWRRAWLPVLAVVSVAALFALGAYVAWSRPAAGFYLVPFRAWELGIGVLLAVVPLPAVRKRWRREALSAAGLAAILGAAAFYTEATPFPGVAALLPTLGAAALIHTGASGESAAGRLLALGPMVFVGLISYSLYLWHWPVLVFLQALLLRFDLTPLQTAAAVAASFVLAALSWRYIERPFRRRGWLSRRKVVGMSVGAIGILAAASALVLVRQGMPERFSPEVQPLVAFVQDPGGIGTACNVEPLLADEGPCRFGAEGVEPTVLLWGDSHAGAIRPAIDVAARSAGVSGLVAWSPACPPVLGLLPVIRPDCLGFSDSVLEALRRHPEIHTVILGGRWARWDRETDPTDPDGDMRPRAMVDDPAMPGEPGPDGLVAFGLGLTIDTLVAEGYAVALIGTTPEFSYSVPEGLLAEYRWGIRRPTTDAADYAVRNAHVIGLFEAFDERPNVDYIPIYDVLCPAECIVILDGQPVYTDEDHLSPFGATTLLGGVLAERIWGVSRP